MTQHPWSGEVKGPKSKRVRLLGLESRPSNQHARALTVWAIKSWCKCRILEWGEFGAKVSVHGRVRFLFFWRQWHILQVQGHWQVHSTTERLSDHSGKGAHALLISATLTKGSRQVAYLRNLCYIIKFPCSGRIMMSTGEKIFYRVPSDETLV